MIFHHGVNSHKLDPPHSLTVKLPLIVTKPNCGCSLTLVVKKKEDLHVDVHFDKPIDLAIN